MDRVVLVGASAAGLTAAEALRREGYTGGLTLIGDEKVLPYDRPPLSKQVLAGTWKPEKTTLRQDTVFADHDIELRLGTPASGLDLAGVHVLRTLDDTLALRADPRRRWPRGKFCGP